jgi:protein-glutamine gamma-glutamyltransferase
MGSPQLSQERLLQIVIAGMMVLATMLFGVGNRTVFPALGAAIAAAGSVYLTDVTGKFRLSPRWANLLSLVTVVVWLVASVVLRGDWQLIAVTYVLLILQVILLFQVKNQRAYWQLVVLSVAQAAVASALTAGLLFGILLLTYTVLGLLALSLLMMQREMARFVPAGVVPGVPVAATVIASPEQNGSARPAGRLLRSAASRPALHLVGTAAELPQAAWRRSLARQTGAIALFTVISTAFVFVLFPRVEREREEGIDEGTRSVGFSKEVTLGEEVGAASQNPDIVMRFELFAEPGGQPFQLQGDPLLRGSVATTYARGKWRAESGWRTRPLEPIAGPRYVRQRITIEPLADATVFAMAPVFTIDDNERLPIDLRGDELVRRQRFRNQRLEYEVATTGIVDRRPASIVSVSARGNGRNPELLKMPDEAGGAANSLTGLRAAAERVKQQAQIADGDRLALARALSNFLRDSNQFEYTLMGQKRDSGVDPLEDFVVSHRRGHCEYFAGALALMLRSQGIPARIAIGFRAGEWNTAGSYYQVRQLHAHTWVEAFLEPEHYANELHQPPTAGRGGAWLVLDPTPASEGAGGDGMNLGLWARAGMYLDYWQVLWGRYVAALDAKWQTETIYQPLIELFGTVLKTLFSPDAWRTLFASLIGAVWQPWNWRRVLWFGLSGVLSGLILVASIVGLYRSGGPIARWWRSRAVIGQSMRRVNRQSKSEIYCRLERALARRGFAQLSGQTPLEFAVAAGGELAESIDHIPLASLPRRVVEAFYHVRFGGRPLDNSEADAVEHALRALEAKL